MIVFDIPKVILQFWEKVKIFNFLGPDLVWCLWTLYVCSWDMVYALGTWYMLYGHGICSWKMGYAVWTWKMSCCWRRISVLYIQYMYCMYNTCFVGGMYFQRRFLRKNDFEKWRYFWKYTIFNKKYVFHQKHYFWALRPPPWA